MQSNLFLMLRHGSTLLNELQNYRGWSNGPDAQLDDAGRTMAREAGAFLSRLDTPIEYVLASDLERAQETAHIVCEILGIKEFHVNEQLRPLNVGDLAGKPKADNPMDYWLQHPTEKFPGGESVADFNVRQYEIAKKILDWIGSGKIKAGSLLIVAHVSNVMYWHNVQSGADAKSEEYLSEKSDVIYPGGVVLVTSESVLPIYRRNNESPMSLSDGTAVSGFVQKIENRPPRACWNCKWFDRDTVGLGECGHPLVRIDPELKDRLQPNGKISVGDEDCCNSFQNHPTT